MSTGKGNVVVIHPDLGVGGAERLIVDASKALQDCGHKVRIYTGYHDKTRCFQETRDGTLEVFPVAQWIPRTIFGKFHALMAYLKMICIAWYIILFSKHDLILCDQVSACIPILKFDFRNRPKIIFYCHFPDQLLTKRETFLKRIYRWPLDWFEEWSTSLAHTILVNSEFTSEIVKKTFRSLKRRDLQILYPCVDIKNFARGNVPKSSRESITKCDKLSKDSFIFLSLNRFERKKDLSLAIEALATCLDASSESEGKANHMGGDLSGDAPKLHLIVAGGYDERLKDSVIYYRELKELTAELDVESHVTFVESPNEDEKLELLQISNAIIYTPENEHFGIVPLEAMAMLRPVIASASGGPLETIENKLNGFLCEHDKESFAKAMKELYMNHDLCVQMGVDGFDRVKRHFSYETFRDRLNKICYPPE